jgi:hypothetical protein
VTPYADDRRVRLIKLVHTVVWAGFVACIVAIPVLTLLGHFRLAALLALIVLGEVFVLAVNCWLRAGCCSTTVSCSPTSGTGRTAR